MKVLMVVDKAPPNYGGAGAQAALLCRELCKGGVHARLVSRRRGSEVSDNENTYLGRGEGDGRIQNVMFALNVFKIAMTSDYDIIHIHGCFYYGWFAALGGRLRGKRIISKVTMSGKDDASSVAGQRYGRLSYGQILLRQFYWSDTVIALNQEIYDDCSNFVDNSRLRIIPNGVDVSGLNSLHAARANHVVFCGTVDRRKGADTLVGAWELIASELPDWSLKLVGPVSDDLVQDINRLARDDRRVLALGRVTQKEAWGHLASSKIFVLASEAEGLSNSLLEARALGLICVVSDIPANRLACGDDAFYCDPRDPSSLARALLQATASPTVDAITVDLDSQFDMELLAMKYKAVYSEST